MLPRNRSVGAFFKRADSISKAEPTHRESVFQLLIPRLVYTPSRGRFTGPKTARNSAEYEHAEGETKLDTESWRD